MYHDLAMFVVDYLVCLWKCIYVFFNELHCRNSLFEAALLLLAIRSRGAWTRAIALCFAALALADPR